MKRVYVILALFAIWCLVAALWYLFSVRGLNPENAQNAGLAIAEIQVMILVSVFLGFGIAWFLREDSLQVNRKNVQALLAERNNMIEELQGLRERSKKMENTLTRARQTFHDDYLQISRDRDQLKQEVSSTKERFDLLKDENMLLQIQLGNEKQKSKDLALDVDNLQQDLAQARQELARKEEENSGVRYFINPFNIAATIESSDIDDLKQIKGIGPVIEKKLNMLGIISFQQISELTPEAVAQISHMLKFFPDRIQRDHWVQQAKQLMLAR